VIIIFMTKTIEICCEMKDNLQIVILVAAFAFAGFRLYQKYIKKDDGKSDVIKKTGSSFSASSKDDDYEPYSKK
jgi:hypothetical protein